MRSIKIVSVMVLLMLEIAACTGYDTLPEGEGKKLDDTASLKALIDSGATTGDGEYRIIDVRPEKKYVKGHIPTAINIPNGNLDAGIEAPPKDKKIIVYCETGGRAQAAAKNKLAPAGYTQIYNWGGFGGWKSEPAK